MGLGRVIVDLLASEEIFVWRMTVTPAKLGKVIQAEREGTAQTSYIWGEARNYVGMEHKVFVPVTRAIKLEVKIGPVYYCFQS